MRTAIYILLLRLSFNLTPVLVDIRGGGPCSRLEENSPNYIQLYLLYRLATKVILQTPNTKPVPTVFHPKTFFLCNPIQHVATASTPGYPINDPPIKLSFVGRITLTKGIGLLLDLLENSSTQFELHLAGTIDLPPPISARLDALISSEHVKYYGLVQPETAYKVIQNTHFFTHLSTHPWEGVPNSLLDAITAQVPILATPVGFIPDLFTTNHLTYIEQLTPYSLESTLNNMISQYPQYREKAAHAYEYASSIISFSNYTHTLDKLLS